MEEMETEKRHFVNEVVDLSRALITAQMELAHDDGHGLGELNRLLRVRSSVVKRGTRQIDAPWMDVHHRIHCQITPGSLSDEDVRHLDDD